MLYKGTISSINTENKKVSVYIAQIKYLSIELQVAKHLPESQVNDDVIVAFLGSDRFDGIVIENLTRSSSPSPLSKETYIHEQISPSDYWVIKHNLGNYPSVTVVDSSGSEVIGDVKYLSNNEVTISFTAAFSGKAYLN